MAILVAAGFSDGEWARWWPALVAAMPNEHLVRHRDGTSPGDIDVALVASPPAGALQGLLDLRFIQSLWAGVDGLLADPTMPVNVPLARLVDPAMNEAMAETALWAALGLQRGFFACARQQREQCWRQPAQPRADEVHVAVLGLGQMGRAVAMRLAANGFRTSGWATRAVELDGVATCAGEPALQTLLAAADIVVNLLPLTASTRRLFDRDTLARMRPGAGLVNLARGAHVVDADLLDALDSGHVSHAVLDVFRTEPLPAAHPYWRHPAVTVLPHTAAQTDPRSAALIAARNIQRWREGAPVEALVDRQRGY